MYIIYDLLLLIALVLGIISILLTFMCLVVAEWKLFYLFLILFIISISTWMIISNTDEQRALNKHSLIKDYGVVTSISENSIHVDGHEVTSNKKVSKIHKTDLTDFHIGDVVEMEFIDGVMENYLIRIEKIK